MKRALVGTALACVVIGVALVVAGGGGVVTIVGIGVLGVAGTLGVSLAFLLVGEAEDRERRESEERRRRG